MSDDFEIISGVVEYTTPRPFEANSAKVSLTFTVAQGSDPEAVTAKVMGIARRRACDGLRAESETRDIVSRETPAEPAKPATRGKKAPPAADPMAEPSGGKPEVVIGGTPADTAAGLAVIQGGKSSDPMAEVAGPTAPSSASAPSAGDTASDPMSEAVDPLGGLMGKPQATFGQEITDEMLEAEIRKAGACKVNVGKQLMALGKAFMPPGGTLLQIPMAQRPTFVHGVREIIKKANAA